MLTHLRKDHSKAEIATALTRITVEDFQEMFEYSPAIETKQA